MNTHQQIVTLEKPSHILVITAYKPRKDFNIHKSHKLESTFIKIISPKKSNITPGIVHRHLKMDLDEFNDKYMNKLLNNIEKENKSNFLLENFNIEFLNFWILSASI